MDTTSHTNVWHNFSNFPTCMNYRKKSYQMMYFDRKETTTRYCIYCVFSFALKDIRKTIKEIIMGKRIIVNREGQYKKAYTSVMISNYTNNYVIVKISFECKTKFLCTS